MIQSINTAGGGGGGGADEKVKVSANDTTEGYLNGKLVAGTNITLTENNDGSNETLTVTATDTNDAAKVSANDTTAGFLNGKLVAGTNITFTENNDGANETLTIAASGLTGFTASQNTASPNNTVNASRLLVDATSTNADAVIQPKGTGALLARLPDGAVTGGNKRGTNAVDLQTSRDSAAQVASGTNATVGGGQRNTASGSDATVVGGDKNTASGASSVCGGTSSIASGQFATAFGRQAVASGSQSFSVGGGTSQNIASGQNSIAMGGTNNASGSYALAIGQQNTASGNYSFAFGKGATADKHGQYAHAAGSYGSLGDCQYDRYTILRITTDATPLQMSMNNGAPATSTTISIANDSTCAFRALVTARRADADNESAGYIIEGVIDNNAGTTAFVGTPTVTVLAEDTPAWDVTVTADNTNDALVFTVTGEVGKTIRWGAVVELMKVTG